MKGFGFNVAVSTLVMHLRSQSFSHGCKPKDRSLKCSAVDRCKIPFVQMISAGEPQDSGHLIAHPLRG